MGKKISKRNAKTHNLSENIFYPSLRNLEIKWIEDITDLNITINKSNLINIYIIQYYYRIYILFNYIWNIYKI